MNEGVRRLLQDYFRRTLGVWLLLAALQIMQTSAFWAGGLGRLPFLGPMLASLVYFATRESPDAVLRTLPLPARDIALFRWWASIGAPAVVTLACMVVSRLANSSNEWPFAPDPVFALSFVESFAALGCLAALPLPMLHPDGKGRTRFAFAWGMLGIAGVYGLPFDRVPRPLLSVVVLVGVVLSIASFVRAYWGQSTTIASGVWQSAAPGDDGSVSERHVRLRGWSVLLVDVARSAAALSVIALAGAWVVRASVVPWLYPTIEGTLVWVFVFAVAVSGCLLTQRWLQAVRALRSLPVGDHRLTLILYGVLKAPAVVACLVAIGARRLSPGLGLDIPLYVLVVLLLAPVTLGVRQRGRNSAPVPLALQQWFPVMVQGQWILSAGALASASHLPPAWFVGFFALVAAGFAVVGYVALLASIRSPAPAFN